MNPEINQINILSILDKLGIIYQKLGGGEYGIIEDGKLTSGYKVNIRGNYLIDFSKDRAAGPPFALVKKHLNLNAHETYKRFEANFDIKNELKRPKNKGSPIKKKNKVIRPYSRTYLTT